MHARFYDELETPLGTIAITVDRGGCLLELKFAPLPPNCVKNRRACEHVRREIAEYFAGDRATFDLALAPAGTPFQQRVWQALTEIPFGQAISYGELAARIDRPKAARAVGQANGANPIPIVIPCHRVIAADGTIGGYSGGLRIKRHLLAIERVALAA
jgi:methylated-DNA-[protein]-cysteine S-methyltransferase